MTLILSKLGPQLHKMGAELAGRQEEQRRRLAEARALLLKHADEQERLAELAPRVARSLSWRMAIPTDKPLDCVHPLPPHPPQATLIAADGSPVEPDRHGVALFYLINIGSIVFPHGTGERPLTDSEPSLCFAEEELYEDDRLVQGNLLDTRLSTAEMAKLARLASEAPGGCVLALSDGPLLLWLLEDTPPGRQEAKLREYLACFRELHQAGAAVAGVIDRPRYGDVLNLLHLASLPAEPSSRREVADNPFTRLTDGALFGFLEPGERSALFMSSGRINDEYRRHAWEYEIGFFYLNAGAAGQPEILRVEVPRWVAERDAPWQPEGSRSRYRLLDLVHAAIYQQCRIARPYPYILGRAHELALVSVEERRDLEMRVIAALARQGMPVRPSEKAQLKELTGSKRRRH